MTERPNEIAFDLTKYDGDKAKMWADICSVLKVLVDQGYIATVRYDDVEIYVVEYDYNDLEMGTPYPYWVTPDEYEDFLCSKHEDEDEETV